MTSLELDRLPWPPVDDVATHAATAAEPDITGPLHWQAGATGRPRGMGEREKQCTQREFAGHLEQAELIDLRTVELPGSMVTLPFGMRMMNRFEAVARRHYEDNGFEEHDYPLLVPPSVMDPTKELLHLEGALLFAGDDLDWNAGRKRAVLSPTGEATVYTHWARSVRTAKDLPILMYRQARYFRPARSGRGLFRSIEATGVYEFQACYPDRAASDAGLVAASRMARRLCEDMHVPTLWSSRPPWTNNLAVAERWIGGDVPLPHGATLQVGCLYDQGDRFSRRYGVSWKDNSTQRYTRHVTGCVTRRLVFAHLFLGMDEDGDLLVHPDLAPVQVAVTSGEDVDPAAARGLVDRLTDGGLRVRHAVADRKETAQLHNLWRRQGVPIRVYLQSPRFAGDRTRVVVKRADTREEASSYLDEADLLAEGIRVGVEQVGVGYLRRANGFVAGRCTPADQDTVRDVLIARKVAVCPLEPTEEAVRAVASWKLGEVLGFNRSATEGPCVITGRPTHGLAYLSPRT